MDLTMIDVTEVPGVSLGDEVVLWASRATPRSASTRWPRGETISYELLTTVGRRIPRCTSCRPRGRRFHAIEPGCAGQQRARNGLHACRRAGHDLKSTSTYEGLYGTDTWALDPRTYWTVSGRFIAPRST